MRHHAGFKRNDATGGIDRLVTSFQGTGKVQVFRPRPRHVECPRIMNDTKKFLAERRQRGVLVVRPFL